MKLIATTVAALLTTASAYAADAVVYNEPVAPIVVDTFSWTGGYVGVNAGYAGSKFNSDINNSMSNVKPNIANPPLPSLIGTWEDNVNGFVGGIQAGYNWQLSNGIVIGAEADFQGSDLKNTNSGGNDEDFFFRPYEITTKVQWWGTVRARLGYAATDRLLVYGTGGIAYGNVKTTYNTTAFDIMDDSFRDIGFTNSKTKAGWVIGAGTEYALTNNWSVKAEYLYTDLGKSTGHGKLDGLIPFDSSLSNKIKINTVRVGLNYKF